MQIKQKSIIILYAEDDEEDRLLMEDALRESHLANRLEFVGDGEELMDYLHRRGKFSTLKGTELPGLILVDLNMPRKDGREAIKEIKTDPVLKSIPTIVLTTSEAEEDIIRSYSMGVNSFIRKPVTFEALVDIIQSLNRYWFSIVELPKVSIPD